MFEGGSVLKHRRTSTMLKSLGVEIGAEEEKKVIHDKLLGTAFNLIGLGNDLLFMFCSLVDLP